VVLITPGNPLPLDGHFSQNHDTGIIEPLSAVPNYSTRRALLCPVTSVGSIFINMVTNTTEYPYCNCSFGLVIVLSFIIMPTKIVCFGDNGGSYTMIPCD